MRVLIENPLLPPYRLALFRALCASEGMEVTVAYGQSGQAGAPISLEHPKGVRSVLLRNRYFGKWPPRMIVQSGLLRLIRRDRCDVVIANMDPRIVTNLLAFAKAKALGIPFVWWGHGIRPRGRFKRVYRALARSADANILYDGAGLERLAELGVPRASMFVAWNSIEIEPIQALRRPYDAHDPTRDGVLYVGRLVAGKRVDLLLDAFAKARPNLPGGTELLIVGEGPECPALERRANELGLGDGVRFLGGVYDEPAMAAIANRAWISVSPGYVGLSAIHTLAYGLPQLVADDEPHSPEIFVCREGETADLFRAGDAASLAAALVALASNPERRRAYGEAGTCLVDSTLGTARMVAAFEDAVRYAVLHRRRPNSHEPSTD